MPERHYEMEVPMIEKTDAEKKQSSRRTSKSDNRTGCTIRELAEELGVGLNQVYQAAKCGEIRVIRMGRRIIVPRSERARLRGE
jgi:excisionase family DNA binding protein